jgi:hypothetical protein
MRPLACMETEPALHAARARLLPSSPPGRDQLQGRRVRKPIGWQPAVGWNIGVSQAVRLAGRAAAPLIQAACPELGGA